MYIHNIVHVFSRGLKKVVEEKSQIKTFRQEVNIYIVLPVIYVCVFERSNWIHTYELILKNK